MIRLSLLKNTIGDDLDRLVARIATPGNSQKRSISDAIRRGFQDNFTQQQSGDGKWEPLAPRTVSSRAALGWGARGPILVRRGVLRNSWVNAGGENHVSSVRQSGGVTIYEEGASGKIAAVHEFGATVNIPARQQSRKSGLLNVGGARNVVIPARPVSILGNSSEQRIMDTIEFVLDSLVRQI